MIIFNLKSNDIICFSKASDNTASFLDPAVYPCCRVKNPPTIRRTIGNTEYTITGRFSPDARETAVEKMRRIILNAKVKD